MNTLVNLNRIQPHSMRVLVTLAAVVIASGCARGGPESSSDTATSALTTLATAGDAGPAPLPGGMDGGMPGGLPPGATNLCWRGAFTFYYNPTLDAVLDGVPAAWNAAARLNAVMMAANGWNNALAAVNSPVRINVVPTQAQPPPVTGQFAADWSNVLCMDGMAMVNVYNRDFLAPDGHHPNMFNTGSFGHPVMMAPAPRPNGVGWTGKTKGPSSLTDVEVLAETLTNPALPAGGFISEADVIFHTHFLDNMNCSRVPWTIGAQLGRYDFQSVALHELGHTLGLDHIAPDGNTPGNVMRPAIFTNETLAINAAERAAIQAMYGPGGPCAPPPPAPDGGK